MQPKNLNKKSVNIKLNDLLPKENVKGGQGKTVFGVYNSAKINPGKKSLSP